MNLILGRARFAILAFTAGWLMWSNQVSYCQAQILRTTTPFHLDDREPLVTMPEPAKAQTGSVAPAAAVKSVESLANSSGPPPLPTRPADFNRPAALGPASGAELTPPSAESKKAAEGAGESAAKKPQRKSYLPEQKPISQISIDVTSKSKSGSSLRPESVVGTATEELPAVMGATAAEMHLGWVATAHRTGDRFGYKPLYFEEVNLERYGRSAGIWQPAISTTRFFGTVPLLPYKMAVHSPHQVYYWDWPYAAGNSAPCVKETFPFQPRAALVEAGILTGGAFLIP